MPIRLLTFADGSVRWRLAGRRLARQANSLGWFKRVEVWNLPRLSIEIPQLFSDNPHLDFAATRGLGYWLWRPYILHHAIRSAPSGETILFLDAGCQLNNGEGSRLRLSEYMTMVREFDSLVMRIDEPLSKWCKADLIHGFGLAEEASNIQLVEPGVFFLRSTNDNLRLLAEWIQWGRLNDHHFLDDGPSASQESADFQEHRHDQSILTCLATRYPIHSIPQETFFEGQWITAGESSPIWATRNSSPILLHQNSLVSRLATDVTTRRSRRRVKRH